ncbi:chromosome segregation in meiosis- protein [Gnomoniopsis smithogilvyi]|uniref:Chromosome segregation in meiosis protein n=1 Tax=Gnomoniopsis smithogilvyi TaxID=1191159 RepID=A0A9W8YIT8_9PEZI|nr:chromosome segregation in meiosis- protein [Gnomoniopsis smithogilvyi]
MASKKATKDSATPKFDDLDTFFLDGDLDDDPLRSPKDSNKRKGPGDLNVDEEVSVAKKARIPRVKLDQERLLSQKGIPALRKRTKNLKLKGKGHEWGDASRLLSFYQDWLDDLFPKAKFIDALAMVEKAGHNKNLQKMRAEWINEGRPKTAIIDEGGDAEIPEQTEDLSHKQAERIAPIFEKAASGRQRTPELNDLFGDDDNIYNATPIGKQRTDSAAAGDRDEPDQDELDALMAMEETSKPSESTRPSGDAVTSLFGDGKPKAAPRTQPQPDEFDELDALIAEAENEPSRDMPNPSAAKSMGHPAKGEGVADGDGDDLDALMAEAETHSGSDKQATTASLSKDIQPQFDDDEEAMAEMDGLW